MEKYTVIRESANWTPDKLLGTYGTIFEALARLPKGYKAYAAYNVEFKNLYRYIRFRKDGIKSEYTIECYH